jgi:SpoVK/Ycf46/Vps4 family AAA+-type ATPase
LDPLSAHESARLPETYDPAFIKADVNLDELAAGLATAGRGRLCLYGPPGTGKTAYGHWLAQELGMPLLIKRGSDLLSKWVGGSERNIAEAFQEAQQSDSILLIDEVDSFLQDREGAHRSWEISSVNEMLIQMESFPGIFIASTNLINGLDQASLRRFDLKVEFGYLAPEQAWRLLARHCKTLGLRRPARALRPNLARLTNLTPGDFAAVARQHRFRPLKSAETLVGALHRECALKKDGRKTPMGFV